MAYVAPKDEELEKAVSSWVQRLNNSAQAAYNTLAIIRPSADDRIALPLISALDLADWKKTLDVRDYEAIEQKIAERIATALPEGSEAIGLFEGQAVGIAKLLADLYHGVETPDTSDISDTLSRQITTEFNSQRRKMNKTLER